MTPVKYLKEVGAQMKRVKWPTFSNFISSFSVVLVIIVIASVVLWLESFAGIQIMEQLRTSFKDITPPDAGAVESLARIISR